MKFGWVRRERLEAAERQLAQVKERLAEVSAERQRLLDALLAGKEDPGMSATEASQTESGAAVDSGNMTAYTTPFDRVLNRFGNAFAKGSPPARSRARVS